VGSVPGPDEVEALKRLWQQAPTWDIEWTEGFEAHRDALAAWHQEQVQRRAAVLDCAPAIAAILEELVHCWLDCVPPQSTLAVRFLAGWK
jgi:hypothetical protein